jgi:hypothetical protein
MSGIDARGFRVPAAPLPDLQDEQAELLAFWLQERGYRVARPIEDGIVEPMDIPPLTGLDDVARSDRIRLEALRFAMYRADSDAGAVDVVKSAEAFRKFLMGVGDE